MAISVSETYTPVSRTEVPQQSGGTAVTVLLTPPTGADAVIASMSQIGPAGRLSVTLVNSVTGDAIDLTKPVTVTITQS